MLGERWKRLDKVKAAISVLLAVAMGGLAGALITIVLDRPAAVTEFEFGRTISLAIIFPLAAISRLIWYLFCGK